VQDGDRSAGKMIEAEDAGGIAGGEVGKLATGQADADAARWLVQLGPAEAAAAEEGGDRLPEDVVRRE
jgi:hypothetical protein